MVQNLMEILLFKFRLKTKKGLEIVKRMVKLTAELIEDSFQYMNPIREYELNLRGK
jgi:hypothetical protein